MPSFPQVRALKPDVLIVTGDHSTPSKLKSHSWHPVPVVLAADTARFDGVAEFGESGCLHGGLGRFEAKYLMPLATGPRGPAGQIRGVIWEALRSMTGRGVTEVFKAAICRLHIVLS